MASAQIDFIIRRIPICPKCRVATNQYGKAEVKGSPPLRYFRCPNCDWRKKVRDQEAAPQLSRIRKSDRSTD